MRTFLVVTDMGNFSYIAESKEDVEYEFIRDFYPQALDDELPDIMQSIEIWEQP